MERSPYIKKLLHGQRGNIAILFALCLPVLLGCAALAVDLARLNLTKVELQNAADAAALAGAKSLSVSSTVATATALQVAQSNFANASQIQVAVIQTGYWDLTTKSFSTPGTPGTGKVPAIMVTVPISSTQNNGPLKLFFAPILGIANISNIQASSIAILNNGTGGPFDYAIFSGSNTETLTFNGSGFTITGSVHTNDDLNINGSSITITGAAEAYGNFSINGSGNHLGSTNVNGTFVPNGSGNSFGSQSSNTSIISMPDFSASVAAEAAAANQTYTGNKTINGSNITSSSMYVQGNLTVNGSAFTATGAVMADGNITINGSGVASGNSQVAFYSKNGDININGSGYNLNGLFYAPNGHIKINGSGIKVNGSVVGKEINVNGSSFTVNRTDFPITSLPLTGRSVNLVQ